MALQLKLLPPIIIFLTFLTVQPDNHIIFASSHDRAETHHVGKLIIERQLLQEQDDQVVLKFDEFLRQLVASAKAPGGQLAVAKGGQLKYFKGQGLANIDTKEPVTTQSVMRYNSISKPITGTAILKLVQEGKLALHDKPFFLLQDLVPPKNANVDPRLLNITVQELLQHSGGWNTSATNFEPVVMPTTLIVSNTLGTPVPATPNEQIRMVKSLPLDFDPGTGYEYSNIGYNVLGRVIEKVTGMKYVDYIQKHLFHVVGIKGISSANSRVEDLEPNEVHYYGTEGRDELAVSVFPGEGYVLTSYGFADYKQADAVGGWVGSAGDLLRWMLHVDGLRKPAILGSDMVSAMLHTPRPPSDKPIPAYSRGLQWFVGEVDDDKLGKVTLYYHDGGAPGAHSLCIRLVKEEVSMAYLLNTHPSDEGIFIPAAIANFTRLVASIKEWPQYDLFSFS